MHTFHSITNSNIMKTILILIITILTFSISHAQENKLIISSSLRFQNANTKTDNQENSTSYFQVTPRILYKLNTKLGIGVLYAASRSKSEYYNNDITKLTGHQVGGFVQLDLINKSKYQIFSDLDASYINSKSQNDFETHTNNTSKGALTSLNIGARYNFYKRLGLEIRLNELVSYRSIKYDSDSKLSSFNLLNDPFQQLSYGLSLTF